MADNNRVDSSNGEPEKTDFGLIEPRSIHQEMSESYLDYAMSVIVARALPDVRDGLKPVQRRILHVMREMGLTANSKHQKSAKIVGQVMGTLHPHGDMAIYDALARQAQWWSLRLPLINGQGNFGSMDGDPPAAMRYTEAKLAPVAEVMLADIDKETVDWQDNYDGSQKEPVVLPTQLPNLLINGSQGIAVGMATNIPPHNLNEVVDGLILLLEKPDSDTDELSEIIKGPDFPTGGIAYNKTEINEALSTGRGRTVVRGRAEIEEEKQHQRIVVCELPYQTNKATFISHLADLVKAKRIEEISDIRDESDRQHGVRVVIDLKSGAVASKILNQLYDLTELQTVVHYNMVALVDGLQPRLLSLGEILSEFLAHRVTVVTRRTEFELKIAQNRLHILEGLKIALDHLDAIIALIRQSTDRESAKRNLTAKYKLTEIQANAILEMRLSQLANLERQKIYDEFTEVGKLIADLNDILSKPERIQKIIKGELETLKGKFGFDRLTEIRPEALGEFTALDLIPEEAVLISLTRGNYVKRLPADTYKSQGRGGKGVIGMQMREDDTVLALEFASTHDDVFFFTDLGRVFTCKAYEIPASSRQSKGVALPNLIRITPEERVTTIITVSPEDKGRYFFFATKLGAVKRVAVELFKNVRKSGVVAMGLKGDDALHWVSLSSGSDEIAQITSGGQVIVYNEDEVRPMGRAASGVRGIKLKDKDTVIETAILGDMAEAVCVISERGIGKKVKLSEFRHQHRGGSGIRIARLTEKTGMLVAGTVVSAQAKDLIIATTNGQVIRIDAKSVKQLSRQASGVILIRLDKEDRVSSLALTTAGKTTDLPATKKANQ